MQWVSRLREKAPVTRYDIRRGPITLEWRDERFTSVGEISTNHSYGELVGGTEMWLRKFLQEPQKPAKTPSKIKIWSQIETDAAHMYIIMPSSGWVLVEPTQGTHYSTVNLLATDSSSNSICYMDTEYTQEVIMYYGSMRGLEHWGERHQHLNKQQEIGTSAKSRNVELMSKT